MKTRNRLLAVLFALVIIVGVLPVSALAESGLLPVKTDVAAENNEGDTPELMLQDDQTNQEDFQIRFETPQKLATAISMGYIPDDLTLGQNESYGIYFTLYETGGNYDSIPGAANLLSLTENGSTISGVTFTEDTSQYMSSSYLLTIPAGALSQGHHTLQLVYAGDSGYNPCTSTFELTVVPKMQQMLVDVQPDITQISEDCIVSGRLVNVNDSEQPVANKAITLRKGTKTMFTTTTDSNGNFSGTIASEDVTSGGLSLTLVSEEDGTWAKLEQNFDIKTAANVHTITFWDGNTMLFTRNVEDGHALGSTNVPYPDNKEDFWFDCWCSDQALENKLDWSYWDAWLISADVNVYASWDQLYLVTIDMNGGTYEGKATIEQKVPVGFSHPIPEKDSMDAWVDEARWITGPAGMEYYGAEAYGKYYEPGSLFTVEQPKEVTLKMLWRPKGTHTLFLNASPAEGGTVEGAGNYYAGNNIQIEATPTDGYVFDGWYQGDAPAGDKSVLALSMPSEDLSLTARFKKTTEVDYSTNPNREYCYDDETYTMDFMIFDEVAQEQALVIPSAINVYIDGIGTTFNFPMTGIGPCSVVLHDPAGNLADKLAIGNHEVKIEFAGNDTYAPCSQTINFTVKDHNLRVTGIKLNSDNAKKEYVKGEDLDVTGLVLEVTRKNDTKDTVDVTEDMVSGFNSSTLGEQVLTVTYEGFTDTYKVLVKLPAYSVTVKADPAEGGMVTGGGSYTEGQSATVKATANPGYEFSGWYDAQGNNVSWDEEYVISSVTKDIDLTAKFIKVWEVTLDMNGGTFLDSVSGTMQPSITRTFEDGHQEDIPDKKTMDEWLKEGTWITAPADSEYIGAEVTDANGTKTYNPGESYTVRSNATIKVLWKSTVTPTITSTITYDLNGGTLNGKTGIVKVRAENGSVIILPAPTREGYTFDYWEGSRYEAGDSYTVNGDHTLTARWKENSPAAPGTKDPDKTSPKTGDGSNLALHGSIMLLSLAGLSAVAVNAKRRRKTR